jgi:lysozyme family protein
MSILAKKEPSKIERDSLSPAREIIKMEARRDKSGNIKIYPLPAGDGGGKFEFAGINDRYHPAAFRKLKSMVDAGNHRGAEEYAAEYIEQYSAPVARKATNPGVQFALQDMAFNRGPTGATRIVQKALGVKVDGKIGPITRAALAKAEADPKQLLTDIRSAREWYERTYAKRAPGNKFWAGMVNRWNKQLEKAISLA